MCGIVGVLNLDREQDFLNALQSANDMARHRGPDGAGFVLLDTNEPQLILEAGTLLGKRITKNAALALGHRRLAIIDLTSAAHQPMSYADGQLWITYNGEIYNYLELRAELKQLGFSFRSQSDTEVILAAYNAWGENCVKRFRGMWAFAIADLTHNKLFCSRDRFGIKPFYYYTSGQQFVFSSEIKQLLEFPFVPRRVNERAVYEYLRYGAVEFDAETSFAGINKLLHGHNLTVDLQSGSLTATRYYQPNFGINHAITIEEAAEEFRRLLTDSVQMHLRSDVAVGTCLSGGLDSSALVCIMSRLLHEQRKKEIQHTVSSHFEDKEANELGYIQEVIRNTGVNSHFVYPQAADLVDVMEQFIWHQEEPFGSSSIFAQWSVFKLASQYGLKVMLDGQGADELLAGYLGLSYHYFEELRSKEEYFTLTQEVLQHIRFQGFSWFAFVPGVLGSFLRLCTQVSTPLSIDWLSPELEQCYHGQSAYKASRNKRVFSDHEKLNNSLYQHTFHGNLQSLLRYEDRSSMAFSVESRVPYLDHPLVEFLFSLPSRFKIREGYTKRVMRDGLTGILPEKIRLRTSKLGFPTPERRWQRTELRPLIVQSLQDGSLDNFVHTERAMNYLAQVERKGKLDYSPWRWLNLSLWLRAFTLC